MNHIFYTCMMDKEREHSPNKLTPPHYHTVEHPFNELLYNEVLGITNDILQPGQSYRNMYGTEPRYNEPRYNEILDITNTIEDLKRKIYPDITNKCHHSTKDECKTDQQP